MISKVEQSVIGVPPTITFPSMAEVQQGHMLRATNVLSMKVAGLVLVDGELRSKSGAHQVDENSHQLMVGDPAIERVLCKDSTQYFKYVSNIREYLDWVEAVSSRASELVPIYRGHLQANYDLLSTFSRFKSGFRFSGPPIPKGEYDVLEYSIQLVEKVQNEIRDLLCSLLTDFIRYSGKSLSSMTPLEWLVYARHSGLPVPVLDFTRDPLVALYFALRNTPSQPTQQSDSVVYATYLQPSSEGNQYRTEIMTVASKGHSLGKTVPVAADPCASSLTSADFAKTIIDLEFGGILSPRSSSSAWLQKSVLLNLGESGFHDHELALSHCFIKDSDRRKIFKELLMLGVDETSIFESADALATSISQRHSLKHSDFQEH